MLALVLGLPFIGAGLFADDYFFLLGLERTDSPVITSRLDLYRFADGVPEHVRWMTAHGPLPWWTSPALLCSFFRPLASALLLADHALFGRWAPGYHVHSLLWFGLLLVAVAWLYRRLPSAGLAATSMLLFALDEGHTQAYGWLSSRHAVVSAAFAVLGLVAHLRAREDGWGPGRVLAPLAFVPALCAGEVGLTALAYVGAYEIVSAPGSRTRRALALAPYAALTVAYLIVYRALGYGVSGSGTYVDPVRETGAYLTALGPRLLALGAGMLTPIPADLWMLDARSKRALVVAGALALVFVAAVFRRAYAELDAEEARHVRWLGVGACLSLLPVAAGALTNRLLLVPSIGAFVILACCLRHAWRGWKRGGAGRARHLAASIVLFGVHVVLGLVGTLFSGVLVHFLGVEMARVGREAEFDAGQKVIVLAASNQLASYFPAFVTSCDPAHRPGAWWIMSMAPFAHRVTRTSERTLEVEVLDGTLFESDLELLFRPSTSLVESGQRFFVDGYEVRVLETIDGRPRRIEARFDASLDDPSLRMIAWRDGRLGRVVLATGESVTIPSAPLGL